MPHRSNPQTRVFAVKWAGIRLHYLAVLILLAAGIASSISVAAAALEQGSAAGKGPDSPSATSVQAGDAVCERCHLGIYESYERTSMAQGSGRVIVSSGTKDALEGNPPSGDFLQESSGIRYRVFLRDGHAWMSYDRPSKQTLQMFDLEQSPAENGALDGEKQLDYFIGSGKHGRTYLYQVDGAWFELPINYYTRRAAWGMAPAFDQAKTMPANLPTDPGCLHCHATEVADPLPGSRSHYAGAPFSEGGVGCSACHGDPSAHLAANGYGPIVNPGHLDAARRDSACLSCHLEGDALVYRPGRSLAQFKAGDDLADTAVYFVRAGRAGGGGRAASQYEALLRSACKRAVGDKLTCTTCHDPHASPAASDRVAYYRGKCLACHTGIAMATTHHPEEQNCAKCHMPTRATTDISHEQAVDHDIESRPASATADTASAPRPGETLLPVGGWKTSDRELGMAYAQLAARGDRKDGERALALLTRAAAAGASDAAMDAQLGFLHQLAGDRDQARAAYLSALRHNPYEPSPLANLAVLDATSGDVRLALGLLERLIAADPTQTAAGLNLAFIDCRLGHAEKARETLKMLARYNPDDPALRKLADTGSYGGERCDINADDHHARQ